MMTIQFFRKLVVSKKRAQRIVSFRWCKELSIVLLTNMAIFSSCVRASEEVTVDFPLLKECDSTIRDRAPDIAKKLGLEFQIREFDYKAKGVEVSGYVVLHGDRSKEEMLGIVKSIIGDCYPSTSTTIHRTSEEWAVEFKSIVEKLENSGHKGIYVDVQKEAVKVYFSYP